MSYECKECAKTFTSSGNLRRHAKKFHNLKVNELAPYEKKNVDLKFKCDVCGKNFSYQKHLRYHQKTHGITVQPVLSGKGKKCSMCDFTSNSEKELLQHFERQHDIRLQIEELQFVDAGAFETWKSSMEKNTRSRYTKKKYFCSKTHTTKKYVCHRSGYYATESKGKRCLKTQGSSKINGFCPSSLTVIVDLKGKVDVKFLKTHVGHQNDIGHLTLTNSERKSIAEKIAAKIPFSVILDEMRDSIENSELERKHLLNKKDLYNIEHAFNLNSSSIRHKEDAISVEVWANEMANAGSLLFYKAQETLNEEFPFLKTEDFLLIIMTDAQAEIMTKYGNDCICVDGTHGLNGYGFELNTILVLDTLRQGFPCAFLISNRSDEEVLALFFSCVQQKVGLISSNVFMSDLANSFYNAWVRVMPMPHHRLYCTWHLDRAWRNNLCKIVSREKQVLVYKYLRTLLEETDKSAFCLMLEEFQNQLRNDPDTQHFSEYFQTHYADKAALWAYCYRVHTGLNTNMHIERMHKTLKYIYLNGKNVKRLDKAISAIMKFVRDKLFDALIIMHKGKIGSKIKDLRIRHKNSNNLDTSSIVPTESGWNIASSSRSELYTVEEYDINCKCSIYCIECAVCIHRYRCSCIDSAIKWNMCKHIHLLCRYRSSIMGSVQTYEQLEEGAESNENNDLMISEDNNHLPESEIILKELSKKTGKLGNLSFDNRKENIKKRILELLDSTTTVEQLEVFERNIAPIEPTLSAMATPQPFPKNAATIPHNKNILPQRKLFATRKNKKTKKHTRIVKPNSEEADAIAFRLVAKL